MPKGPKGEKRHADVIQAAIQVARIATGDEPENGKDPAAVALGRRGGLKGGKARAESLSPARRKEIAQKAAKERWKSD